MTRWFVGAAVLAISMAAISPRAGADPSTQPVASDSATTQPTVVSDAASSPKILADASSVSSSSQVKSQDSSADDSSSSSKFPTPAELLAKMKQMHDEQSSQPQVAYFNLDGPVVEKPSDFSLFAQDSTVTLRTLLDRLDQARHDKDIRAVLITLGDGELNISQALELRAQLDALRRDGKRTFVYGDSYDTDTYIAASGATDVCLLQGGEIMIPGVGFETMFAKNLLDKVGVDADYVQIGEYKGADEEYTRSEPSDELNGQLNKLADSLFDQIIDSISLSRNMTHEDVKDLVDQSLIPAQVAKDRGLVDHLVDMDGLPDLLADEIGQKVDLVHDYGAPPKDQVDLSSPFAILSLLTKKPEVSDKPAIAVVYAEGEIVDGTGGTSMLGGDETIGSDDIRQALRMAARDDKVQAVVIRIDSPGGSALASEVMWQAVRRVAKTKPVIISVGSEAASGGYYLASSGDYIFADPTAIVGSIGVVGGKFVVKNLMDKLGLNTASFMRGKNADLFSNTSEWTDDQRRQVTQWMRDTYDMFTTRVMTTRTGKINDIDSVARGRIYSAKQAKDLGMVDSIGGIEQAIAYAAGKADLRPGEYDVRVLPPPHTLADYFNGGGDDDSDSKNPFAPRIEISQNSVLAALPPDMRQAVGRQLEVFSLLSQKPVVLVSPYVLVTK
ncbi:MAG: signal peptide peptidase SppA [Tepidisphaeraceae bacterium]